MGEYKGPLIDEWPTISFESCENIEIENGVGRFLYKSFFRFLRGPEIIVSAFSMILKNGNV